MVTLHRCQAPTDWLCPCGRVARALKAAGEEVEEVRAPLRRKHRDDVQALSGQRVVPVVAFADGEVICDSKRIIEHLAWRGDAAGG